MFCPKGNHLLFKLPLKPYGADVKRVVKTFLFGLFNNLFFGAQLGIRFQDLHEHLAGKRHIFKILFGLHTKARNIRITHAAKVDILAASYERLALVGEGSAFFFCQSKPSFNDFSAAN